MSTQNTETPPEFVKAVEDYFKIHFSLDLAGSEENKKAPLVLTEKHDSFVCSWSELLDGRLGWLNPTFRNLTKWINKCLDEVDKGARFVTLWPLSGDLNQLPVCSHPDVSVYIIHGRIWPVVRACMLCVWDNTTESDFVSGLVWDKKAGTLTKAW